MRVCDQRVSRIGEPRRADACRRARDLRRRSGAPRREGARGAPGTSRARTSAVAWCARKTRCSGGPWRPTARCARSSSRGSPKMCAKALRAFTPQHGRRLQPGRLRDLRQERRDDGDAGVSVSTARLTGGHERIQRAPARQSQHLHAASHHTRAGEQQTRLHVRVPRVRLMAVREKRTEETNHASSDRRPCNPSGSLAATMIAQQPAPPAPGAAPAEQAPAAADDDWKPTEIKNLTVLPKDTSPEDVMKIIEDVEHGAERRLRVLPRRARG